MKYLELISKPYTKVKTVMIFFCSGVSIAPIRSKNRYNFSPYLGMVRNSINFLPRMGATFEARRVLKQSLITLIFITLLLPTELHAQAQPMQTFVKDFPFWDGSGTGSYIEALYKIAISLAAVLVVLRLMWAGVKYMFSEVVTNKQEAKEDIKSALLGLLIILGAVTILITINPQLTNLDVVGTGPSVQLSGDAQGFRYDLKVGDSWTHSSVLGHCDNSNNRDACYQDRVDYLKESCASNDGVLKQELYDIGTAGTCAASTLRYGGLGYINAKFNLDLIPECGRSWVCTESQ